jgi:PadR family transcriptional regulator PadR
VLALLRDRERYAFELVCTLSEDEGMVTGEGTLYPLLARLRREGLVETTCRESRPGRYYTLTARGEDVFAASRIGRRSSCCCSAASCSGSVGSPV